MMPKSFNQQLSTYSEIQSQAQEAERSERFDTARLLQEQLVQMIESNATCSSGMLGDALFKLAFYSYKCGFYKVAQMEVAKSIGYRRLFFGKGNVKVQETVELAKLIQNELSKLEPRRVRRKRLPLTLETGRT